MVTKIYQSCKINDIHGLKQKIQFVKVFIILDSCLAFVAELLITLDLL